MRLGPALTFLGLSSLVLANPQDRHDARVRILGFISASDLYAHCPRRTLKDVVGVPATTAVAARPQLPLPQLHFPPHQHQPHPLP